MSEIKTQPAEALILPRQGVEVAAGNGAVFQIDGQSLGTIVDAEGLPREVVAAFDVPDYVYNSSADRQSTVVCVSLAPDKKHKKSDPKIVLTRMHRGADGTLTAIKPKSTKTSSWDELDSTDPGYDYDVSLIRPSRRGAKPTHATVNFKEKRFYKPGERIMNLDEWAAYDRARGKSLPSVITSEPSNIEVVDLEAMWTTSNTADKARSRHDRLRTITKVGAWIGAVTAGAVLAAGANATGGFYDKTVDLRHNASDFVHDKFQGESIEQRAAIDRVARTMQDLDTGNVDEVKGRAALFEQKFSNELIPQEQLANFQEQITQATTHERVTEIASEFMKFYGSSADLLNTSDPNMLGSIYSFNEKETPLENLKASTLGTISAISLFPKSIFIASFNFRRIEFGTAGRTFDQHGVTSTGARGELVSPSYNSWRYVRLAVPIEPVDKQTLHDEAASVILHELYHSREDREFGSLDSTGNTGTPQQHKEFADKEFWDDPEYASTYAMASGGEEQGAETFAHTFTPGNLNRFASPDAVRRFESKLGIDMLRELIKWEQRAPGIVDHLMNTNTPGFKAQWYTAWLNPS